MHTKKEKKNDFTKLTFNSVNNIIKQPSEVCIADLPNWRWIASSSSPEKSVSLTILVTSTARLWTLLNWQLQAGQELSPQTEPTETKTTKRATTLSSQEATTVTTTAIKLSASFIVLRDLTWHDHDITRFGLQKFMGQVKVYKYRDDSDDTQFC